MNRRHFLKTVALGGVTMLTHEAWATSNVRSQATKRPWKIKAFELEELTVGDLQEALRQKRFTALSLAKKYLARLEDIDQRGPGMRAVIEINPEALAIAKALDEERRVKGPRGPLHGIPMLIKDNLDTHDRMTTTAGSLALAGSIPQRDSFVVQKLRAAGAVILGKTNLSEWANFRSTRSISGWSGRGGQTRNPYALDRNPSGSSSGSAAAVSANLCALAIGTETDGSILSPSSYCGIVGLKPTVGLISRTGIIPIAHSQDTAGPMARTVTDAAILLGALTGTDNRDKVTLESVSRFHTDYTQFLDTHALRGARIGVARQFFGKQARVDRVIEEAMAALKNCGAVIIDPADLPSRGKFGDSEFTVLLYEFKADLNAYLASLGPAARARSLKEIIEFNEKNRDAEMPFFGQEIMVMAEAKGPLTETAYLEALAKNHRLARTEGIDAIMDKHQLDALIAPTTGPAHALDIVYGDRDTGGSTGPAAIGGYPSITVPAGAVLGLPVGLSFFGRAYSEPKLLALAYAFEQSTRFRRPPQFLPSLPMG